MTDQTHPLTLYNSLTRTKEKFIPLVSQETGAMPSKDNPVTMYNCGPTVYSYAHIGNARAAVVADVLFRVLRHIYGEDAVVYARNITDVDDKIIASAQEQGVDISEITEKYARIYNEDLAALNCLKPTMQPKATEHIQEMADIIITLMDKDIAYEAEGHILFDVTKDEDYGKLSGRSQEDNRAGARVEVAGYKRNAGDFVLWKPAKDGEPGWSQQESSSNYKVDWRKYGNRPFAVSPGRPGWHIECSAMAKATLGETIDIHCGGVDLKFPHHENEIAQSECANDKEFSKFWVHNEFLNMGTEKMSKSLGNVTLVHDLLKDWDGEVIRLALLKAHYRSELNWSEDLLKESKKNLHSWYQMLREARSSNRAEITEVTTTEFLYGKRRSSHDPEGLDEGLRMLFSDLNSLALTDLISILVGDANFVMRRDREEKPIAYIKGVTQLANLLGLLQKDPEDWFTGGISDADKSLAADYDAARATALEAKSSGDKAAMGAAFKKSDAIRAELSAKGLVLETSADGTSKLRKA